MMIISTQFLEKLKYLIRKYVFEFHKVSLLSNEMTIKKFYEIIALVIHGSAISIQFLPSKANEISYNTELIYNLYEKYNKLIPEEKRKYDLMYMDVSSLIELIDIVYQIKLEVTSFYYMCDLIGAEEDCLKNMKYFVDATAINRFKDEYDRVIKSTNINKMQTIFIKYNVSL